MRGAPLGTLPRMDFRVAAVVTMVGCACGSAEPSVSLEILSPAPGQTAAAVHFKVTQSGPLIHSVVTLHRVGSPDLTYTCAAAEPECDGSLDAPALEADFELFATVTVNDAAQTQLTSARKPVHLNGELVSLAPLALGDQHTLSFIIASRAAIDPATLQAKATRQIARLPYIDAPNQQGVGLREQTVPVTVELDPGRQRLLVRGDLRGPARYTIDLTGVANEYGQHVKEAIILEQPYFLTADELGDIFISGSGISPHFEKSSDGRLFAVVNGSVRVLENRTWTEVVQWTGSERATVSPAGEVLLFAASQSGAMVRRWTGSDFDVLPVASTPPAVPQQNNTFECDLATSSSGELFVAVFRAAAWPYATHARIHRFDGSTWQQIADRAFAAPVPSPRLVRFGDGVALMGEGVSERWAGGQWSAFEPPSAALPALGPGAVLQPGAPRADDAGRPVVMAFFEDLTQGLDDFVRRQSGTVLLRFDGAHWTPFASGNPLADGWGAVSEGGALHIEQFQIRSWLFDPSGTPVMFAREAVNPTNSNENLRLNISAFAFRDGGWLSLADAPSPLLAEELHLLPGPFPRMAPIVNFDAAYDAAGHLWAIDEVGSHGGTVATANFVLNVHP